jgi:Mor family transcriptional regulator
MSKDDIVSRMVALAVERGLERRHAVEVERQIRHEFGGDEPYVSKAPRESGAAKADLIAAQHQNGADTARLSKEHGLSRRRVQQLLRIRRNVLP